MTVGSQARIKHTQPLSNHCTIIYPAWLMKLLVLYHAPKWLICILLLVVIPENKDGGTNKTAESCRHSPGWTWRGGRCRRPVRRQPQVQQRPLTVTDNDTQLRQTEPQATDCVRPKSKHHTLTLPVSAAGSVTGVHGLLLASWPPLGTSWTGSGPADGQTGCQLLCTCWGRLRLWPGPSMGEKSEPFSCRFSALSGCNMLSLHCRDIHSQLWGIQGLCAAVKAWMVNTGPGQGGFTAEPWTAWVTDPRKLFLFFLASPIKTPILFLWMQSLVATGDSKPTELLLLLSSTYPFVLSLLVLERLHQWGLIFKPDHVTV